MTDKEMEIEHLQDLNGGNVIGYYARGHQDPAAFVSAVLDWSYPQAFKPEDVRHTYYRCVPVKADACDYRLDEVQKGRGAFAVTVIDKLPRAEAVASLEGK